MTLWDLDTPTPLVELPRLQSNIADMAGLAAAHGKRLRPHVKTHKSPDIARMQASAGVSGITVAKLGEAEAFAEAGFDEIFIANLLVGGIKMRRLVRLASRVSVTVGVDSLTALDLLKQGLQGFGVSVGLMIEVDTGHGRAGVKQPDQAAALARSAAESASLALRGLYTHEGHVYRAQADRIADVCERAVSLLCACRTRISGETDAAEAIVSVGSTPGADEMVRQDAVKEIRPGNYVFYDAGQVRLGRSAERCALTVLTTVIARPSATEALVDAGTKALSGDRDPVYGYGFVEGDPRARLDWCSEEHGHVHLGLSDRRPRVGDKVRIVPAHACTCTNMHPFLNLVDDEHVVGRLPVAARDRLT